MPIIDSQVHVYEANTPERPWHSVPNWPDHVNGAEMVAAMDAVGVDGAIFISAFSMYQYDASYALEVHARHAGRSRARRGFPRGMQDARPRHTHRPARTPAAVAPA